MSNPESDRDDLEKGDAHRIAFVAVATVVGAGLGIPSYWEMMPALGFMGAGGEPWSTVALWAWPATFLSWVLLGLAASTIVGAVDPLEWRQKDGI